MLYDSVSLTHLPIHTFVHLSFSLFIHSHTHPTHTLTHLLITPLVSEYKLLAQGTWHRLALVPHLE